MAASYTVTGSLQISMQANASGSGDVAGTLQCSESDAFTFASAGGTAPTISGWVNGELSLSSATDLLVAHATDPFQGAGDASYFPPGFSVASSKLKAIRIKNTHASASCDVQMGASNGLPIFKAASDGLTLAPGDEFVLFIKAGTAALTTTSNDKLTLTPSASCTLEVTLIYGP